MRKLHWPCPVWHILLSSNHLLLLECLCKQLGMASWAVVMSYSQNHRPSQHLGSNLWLLWADELLVLSHLASFFVFNGTVHHHLY
jgi:hypothetical protein